MSEWTSERAEQLRSMGIHHELLTSDADLVAMVDLLLELGVSLDDMVDADLTSLGAPRMIRPEASIEPGDVFSRDADDVEFRHRASVALGYNIDEDSRLLTPAEVDAVEFFSGMRNLVGEEDMLALLRVLGGSMGTVARSVITSLRLHYETPILEETGSLVEVFRSYQAITEEMLPRFLTASAAVLRRHVAVAAASQNLWNVDRSHAGTMEQTAIGFVDMVGFTSFTERANLEQFVVALRSFESQAQAVIVENSGTLIKLIGDEVMFSAPTPASAIKIARQLSELPLGDSGPGSVRIGLAFGDVVAVGGDFYGTVVNIASRAVQHAEPDEIVMTAAVANGAHASTLIESIGPRSLRGISEPVELFRLA